MPETHAADEPRPPDASPVDPDDSRPDEPSSARLDTSKPFTRATAREHGLTDADLRGAAYRTVMHSVHVGARIPDTLVTRGRAALALAPAGGVLSHHTAARLWAPAATGSTFVHVSFDHKVQMRHEQVKSHCYTYPLALRWRHGLPVTSPGMTFMHMATKLDLIDLVVLGDQFVRRKLITCDELRAEAADWQHHGRMLGQRAAALVRLGAASVPETHVRLLLVLAGLPEPELQHAVQVDAQTLYLLDLAYPWVKLAVEYDGRWHDDPEQKAKDKKRRKALRAKGWTVIVLHAEDLYDAPAAVVAEVAAELRRLGHPLGRVSNRWRRWFGRLTVADGEAVQSTVQDRPGA